jgi:hypothetical protein
MRPSFVLHLSHSFRSSLSDVVTVNSARLIFDLHSNKSVGVCCYGDRSIFNSVAAQAHPSLPSLAVGSLSILPLCRLRNRFRHRISLSFASVAPHHFHRTLFSSCSVLLFSSSLVQLVSRSVRDVSSVRQPNFEQISNRAPCPSSSDPFLPIVVQAPLGQSNRFAHAHPRLCGPARLSSAVLTNRLTDRTAPEHLFLLLLPALTYLNFPFTFTYPFPNCRPSLSFSVSSVDSHPTTLSLSLSLSSFGCIYSFYRPIKPVLSSPSSYHPKELSHTRFRLNPVISLSLSSSDVRIIRISSAHPLVFSCRVFR